MPDEVARSLFGRDGGPQVLVVHLAPSSDALASKEALEGGLRSTHAAYDVYFEDALVREYGAALNDLRSLSALTASIALVSVILGSHNLAWLAAEERQRVIGVLRTLGFSRVELGRYLFLRAGLITAIAYLLAWSSSRAFLVFGASIDSLLIGGTETSLDLSPATALLGLVLACAASLAGTALAVRRVLRATPASLLAHGTGGSHA
jgi:ABC-type antimicrobial peptide transport system permease subunit